MTIKSTKYDGSSSWFDYKCHFEVCANITGWSRYKKRLFLAFSLLGQEQAVLSNLSRDRDQQYETLVRSLQEISLPLIRRNCIECREMKYNKW